MPRAGRVWVDGKGRKVAAIPVHEVTRKMLEAGQAAYDGDPEYGLSDGDVAKVFTAMVLARTRQK